MTASDLRTSSFGSRLIDILVLTLSFLLFAMMTNYVNIDSLIVDLVLYVVVMFICLRISKRIVFQYVHSPKRFVNILTGNVVGLSMGGLFVFLINLLVPGMKESMVIMFFSSILAFFILGTLSPMVKSSHRDIIHR